MLFGLLQPKFFSVLISFGAVGIPHWLDIRFWRTSEIRFRMMSDQPENVLVTSLFDLRLLRREHYLKVVPNELLVCNEIVRIRLEPFFQRLSFFRGDFLD